MTQVYYTERLLSKYITVVQQARLQEHSIPSSWILQEDNDGSHGHNKQGLASGQRDVNWVPLLTHPPQSPDLNPMEACWNILKQRVRRRYWNNLEELKSVIQAITMDQVRARIAEMPHRCKMLVKTGGQTVRTEKW